MRTDLHRPSVIVPSDYVLVACDYYGLGDAEEFGYDREIFRQHMAKTGGKFVHIERDSGGCDVCGAHCAYVARFYHVPSNSYIVTGMDCAAKMEIGDPLMFANFKKRAAAGLKAYKGKAKAREVLHDKGMDDVIALIDGIKASLDAWNADNGDWWSSLTWEQRTAWDMFNNLAKYGSLKSDKQEALLRKLPAQHAEKVAKKAQWEAERAAKNAAAQPLPLVETRVTIVGTIVSVKLKESAYGDAWKMLVEHADGWKVWGSVPSALLDEVCNVGITDALNDIPARLKGKRIEFDAKVKVSDNDPKFGFFNRPTKAGFVDAAIVA